MLQMLNENVINKLKDVLEWSLKQAESNRHDNQSQALRLYNKSKRREREVASGKRSNHELGEKLLTLQLANAATTELEYERKIEQIKQSLQELNEIKFK